MKENPMELTKSTLHQNLNPIVAMVKKQYLEDLNTGFGSYLSGEIIQISSYKGHQPTFTVRLTDGTVFSYLPVAALVTQKISCDLAVDLAGMTCNTFCPSEDFVTYTLKGLQGLDIHCWDKKKQYLDVGKYLFTIEWHTENELCHLIELDSGQMVLVPNHKMLALPAKSPKPKFLPEWKKLHREWLKPDNS